MAPVRGRAAGEATNVASLTTSITGGSATERGRALQDLVDLFNKRPELAVQLSAEHKGFHKLLEALFTSAVAEKQAYFSGKKAAKAASATRLTKTAEALRFAINYGASRMKRKVTRAVVDHITETLPGPNEDGFVEPLLVDYVKALILLIRHPANVEQLCILDGEGWITCVDFLIGVVNRFLDGADSDPASWSRASPAPGAISSLAYSTARSGASSTQRSGTTLPNKALVELLVQGILALVSSPNAPLASKSTELTTVLTQVLQVRQWHIGALHQAAFGALSCIVSQIQGDNLMLAGNIARDVLPLVSHWWHPRSSASQSETVNSVREEILRLLYGLQLHIESLATASPHGGIVGHIEDVLDALWFEYPKREDRTRLQLGDITFSCRAAKYFDNAVFGLRPFGIVAERRWAVVEVMALLEAISSRAASHSTQQSQAGDEQPRKKRRIESHPSRLRDRVRSADVGTQLTALQVLPFFLPKIQASPEEQTLLLSDVMNLIGNRHTPISSWAMIACASFTSCQHASDPSLSGLWKQVWRRALRSISLAGACRAACVLLHSILEAGFIRYHDIADDINSIVTAADTSGPALLMDSSLILMHHILHLRSAALPSASQLTSNHIIRWVFSRWKPADFSHSSTSSVYVYPVDLVELLRSCFGATVTQLPYEVPAFGGPISQAWKSYEESEEMMRYLLLLSNPDRSESPHSPCRYSSEKDAGARFEDPASSSLARKTIAELLHPILEEFGQLSETWSRRGVDGGAVISEERMQGLVSFCITVALLIPEFSSINGTLSREIESALFALVEKTIAGPLQVGQDQALFDECIRCLAPYIPRIDSAGLEQFFKDSPMLLRLFSMYSAAFQERRSRQSSAQDPESMEVDDDFEPLPSQRNGVTKPSILPRQCISLSLSPDAFFLCTVHRLHLLSIMHEDSGQIGWLPEPFLDQLTQLPNESFLLCRVLMQDIFNSDMLVTAEYALRVVEKVGAVIGDDEYSSCETAYGVCLDILEAFLGTYSDEKLDVSVRIGDLYTFIVKLSLPKNKLSPNAQIRFSSLLYRLLEANASYAAKLGLPSCRSTLFSVLKKGTMPVKYYIGANLTKIFALYVLKAHEEIFLDILDSLPSDPECAEGIAFRLMALAEMACKWPTLLRRSIYHIFETPGKLKHCTAYATRCLLKVSKALDLGSPKDLFALFMPQILYTWLERDSLEDIPFEIFGFQNLDELLAQAKGEAAALLLMRGQEAEALEIAKRLHETPASMVQQSFSKIMAYCLAHDIAMSKDKQALTGESRTRNLLGKEPFLSAIHVNLADIVATLFNLIDQENPIETYFARDENLRYASDNMVEIKKFGHAPTTLPSNQQPMFKAKYLTSELSRLYSRTHFEWTALWTPALVVSVARSLLNTLHPALGSLHSCSVLRKLRVVVALAGPQALSSYPLEMLLHSIRPFIQDAECADDALGLTQYLISRGKSHLAQSPSFFAGYALSMLASLRMFLESSQASTTQESAFKATMTNAQLFHNWFSKYLQSYDSRAFRHESQRAAFRSITQSAARIRTSGNAEKGTPESTLLLEILKDGERDDRLLNDSARDLTLSMLCGDFKFPSSSRNDIIDTDQNALDHNEVVWKSCGAQSSLNQEYLAWAGRVVGRSFAASGEIDEQLVRESSVKRFRKAAVAVEGSEEGLLSLLETLTLSNDSVTAGLAESAVRTIVTEATAQADHDLLLACQNSLSEALFASSNWDAYRTPPSDAPSLEVDPDASVFAPGHIEQRSWTQDVAVYLALSTDDDFVLSALPPILERVRGFAEQAFPFVVHLVLLFQLDKQQTVKRDFSAAAKGWLTHDGPTTLENVKLLVSTIFYLRTQPLPNESTIADRSRWLDIDTSLVAAAASRCGMYKTALLLAEMAASEQPRGSRRSSAAREAESTGSTELLLRVFENIDDPDAYYGLPQSASLGSVLSRLEHEKDGIKTLAFRGAQYDSHLRRQDRASATDGQSLVQALSDLGLAGLSHSLLQTQQASDPTSPALDSTFTTARRLGIWNLPTPAGHESHAVTVYKAYQNIVQAADLSSARRAVHDGFGSTMRYITKNNLNASALRRQLGALAALTEMDDLMGVTDPTELDGLISSFETRSKWMMSGRYEDVSQILSCRETTLSAISQQAEIRGSMKVSPAEARLAEVRGMLLASSIYRFHHATQESLNLSTSLADLIDPSEKLGLSIDAAIKMEVANSLWDHDEMIPSIRMLQSIDRDSSLKKQMVPVSRSDLLSKTGYQVSVARLETPDSIQKQYLEPALRELKGKSDGREAGQVFHQFAMFCDEQLQNADALQDLTRLQSLRNSKSDEVSQLRGMVATAGDSQTKKKYLAHLAKAQQWLDLDQQELRRAERTRDEFVRLSLENYLLALIASDEHNNDALRFTALWLEKSAEESTNDAVKRYLAKVPTRKLAPLMNQLSSRLQDDASRFQQLLLSLIHRICVDHPYHGMYQIWSGTKIRANAKDEVAVLRQRATEKVASQLKNGPVSPIWVAIDKTSRHYHALASERDADRYKANQKMDLNESSAARGLVQALAKYHIPPPTLQIELSADKDYSHVPTIAKMEKSMAIASGVSAPKIITAVGSDGKRYKQLVKGGNDDLRQDAIMEQVFAAVSSLLKLHRATRRRSLGIRTYKVLPLTATSGLIEFVSNTVALHEYLMPAHEKYHPKDLKGSNCRKEIFNVQNKSIENRISIYRRVTEMFQPVMRYFFMEKFPDPDDWFVKRLTYTRTTAAISMLGHVLGLGDRHGHNILLDEKTGEVVHIDLGVAFEMGRVLPVAELVPFRLTRDVVDGMGLTGTEGVFRRCCEFTLDALREETYSIMTILDVLRYDPLYSWSISPVRMAKLQDARRTDEADTRDEQSEAENRKVVNEPSEADRALEVVQKKLSKTLSVTATVNDLINQATDVRNLAVLYSGWAAYA